MSSGGALPHCRTPFWSGAQTSIYRTRNVAGQVGGCSNVTAWSTSVSGPLFNDTLACRCSFPPGGSVDPPGAAEDGKVHAAGSVKFIEWRGLFWSGALAGAIALALLAFRGADVLNSSAVKVPEIPLVMSLALFPFDCRNTRTAVFLPATRCWLLS